jgi:diaminobutyrate-2-oxoglutarate transaminase
MRNLVAAFPQHELTLRGRGLMRGLVPRTDHAWASRVAQQAFQRGLLIETAGPRGEVLKFLMALTIEDTELKRGLEILRASIAAS